MALLKAHGVEAAGGHPHRPALRTNPQFTRETRAKSLKSAGIEYSHLGALGGFATQKPDFANTGLAQLQAFAANADYMQTPEFREAVEKLVEICGENNGSPSCVLRPCRGAAIDH